MSGDAADDIAIWVNREQPAESVVIGTNKKAGLHVYDLAGRELQFVPLGKTNNIDLRSGFSFRGGTAPILAVSTSSDVDRDGTILLLRFDEAARRVLPDPQAKIATGLGPGSLGVCLYQSEDATFVGAAHKGAFRQWRLESEPDGSVIAELVRELTFKSPAEACVFDDALQRLYIAEEKLGLWRLSAEPGEGAPMALVEAVKPKGGLASDIEGLTVYARDTGTGYLIASSQGDSSFRVYRRDGDNHFVDSFRIVGCPDGTVDGVTHTDGIEVSSASLGANWPAGILIVQDNRNTNPEEPQNFKYVPWDWIESRFRQSH